MVLVFAVSAMFDGGTLFQVMIGATGDNPNPEAFAAQGTLGALLIATLL